MSNGFAFDLGEWFSENAIQVQHYLRRYFDGGCNDQFAGRWFEIFAAAADVNKFAPSDVLAVEALSVKVPTESAARLLITEADQFNGLLAEVPDGIDLWDVPRSDVEPESAAAQLHTALMELKGVGYVTAGKLLAAKRPRLLAILDSGVKRLLVPPKGQFWANMHDQLADKVRRQTIEEVCAAAPSGVSLLRRIDVALWMHATERAREDE
ncbi:DUF6308 family protein [Mycobacterium intracellulare]|uniref:DUF6308 family protein n=1 Tax=Mycobacterium intracellulare TaxID=1767 RepID=UPI00109E82CD|nr:DUF6308 family protein [Mycobacterium intracellulare]BCO62333.1 hypothetical protein MINTM006_22830 [Mycobacterium intracellulare]BCP20599.1 hypothetical protein MINTM023_23880 [Mycobacterium intracellulare]BCP31576.1 hypothetical protein MINTM026_25460 [Mycobacterium intracellulare]